MLKKLEALVYNLVKDNPEFKNKLKYTYQKVNALFSSKSSNFPAGTIILDSCFFGFHDKSPWSDDGKSVIAHRHNSAGNELLLNHGPVEIVKSDTPYNEVNILTTTNAFNWQQGSQLQWVPHAEDEIIFNDFHNGYLVAKSLNLKTNDVRFLEGGVAAISPDSKCRASFCFQTFGKFMHGYGYDFEGNQAKSPIVSGVLVVYNTDNEVIHSVNVREIVESITSIKHDFGSDFDVSKSFFSHSIFSPDSQKLAFMLRWQPSGKQLKSKILVLDLNSHVVKDVGFSDMASHYCWYSNSEIFAFARKGRVDSFYIAEAGGSSITQVDNLIGFMDGHPHSSDDGLIVFDTYPDRKRSQHLYVFSRSAAAESDQVVKVASVYAPLKFRDESRVDLHPRIRRDGQFVSIECSHTGRRSMAILPLSNND